MFLCVLLGGLTVGITVGLLDVLVFQLDAISSQKTVSAGVDLGLGLLLVGCVQAVTGQPCCLVKHRNDDGAGTAGARPASIR